MSGLQDETQWKMKFITYFIFIKYNNYNLTTLNILKSNLSSKQFLLSCMMKQYDNKLHK